MTDEEKKEIVSLVISEIESRGIKVEETDEAADASVVQTLLGVNANEAMVRIAVDKVGATAEQVTQIETNRANIENLATTVAENTETLQSKQDVLASGENIKTINGNSILGEGDITITGSGSDITVDEALNEASNNPVQNKVIAAALKGKQDSLEGETILTINNTELALGGRITIEGGSGGSVTVDTKLDSSSTNPVQNKVVTAEIAAAIEEGKNLVLQEIFTAAGAVYNADGYYSLNGIENLSEDDMFVIYNEREGIYRLNVNRYFQDNKQIRTIIPCRSKFMDGIFSLYPIKGNYLFYGCKKLEVLQWYVGQPLTMTDYRYIMPVSYMSYTFTDCENLRTIYPIDVSNVTNKTSIPDTVFRKCTALKELRLYGLKHNLTLSYSGALSKDSILYIINNSAATSDITITLHANVYAKCKTGDDWNSDIVAALEAKYGVGTVTETDTTMTAGFITLQSA